jgi:hypothetical protein
MSKIKSVQAYEILASGGLPTIECVVETEDGFKGVASVSYGASAGSHEAVVLSDQDPSRYGGKGVLGMCKTIGEVIAPKLVGMDVTAQQEIDDLMIALDGTTLKSKLGGNTILAVSMAVARAGAASAGLELFAYLEKTFGVLVYQDDLLLMSIKIAGYSWGEADKFRKAVGKKIPEEMQKQKAKFIDGCVNYSKWPLAKAEELWHWIEPFAAYGFNKAHSASYGRVAYQTAFMKANYPIAFMTAILTEESGDIDKISEIVSECKRMKIEVLPPNVNYSMGGFSIVENLADPKYKEDIRFGL